MSVASNVVRLTARTALKKNWLNAVIACVEGIFAYFLCYYSAYLLEIVAGETAGRILFLVLAFFLLLPLFSGLIRYFWRMIFGVCDHPASVFWYFSETGQYLRAVKVWGALALRGILFGFLLFLPSAVLNFFSKLPFYDFFHLSMPLWAANLGYLALLCRSVAAVIFFFVMLRYYTAPFLAVADENMDIAEVFHMSVVISKMSATDFLVLLFSFLGWAALSLLMIPMIFTIPYFLTACSVHVRFVIAQYNQRFSQTQPQQTPTFSISV